MRLNKVLFMARKLVRDLKAIKRRHRLQLDVAETELSYYYFHFQEDLSQLNRLIATFDEQGVPLNRAYMDVEQPALHYYPISIGQYALAVFHSYLDTGDEEKRQHFLRIVDWFVDNKELDPQLGTFWRTYIPKPEYQVAEGWKSAFSQSRGISLLLRAWQISSDNQYLRLATDALYCFGYDIQEGAWQFEGQIKPLFTKSTWQNTQPGYWMAIFLPCLVCMITYGQ